MSVTTKEWMDAAGIDPLEGPARTAELLVASAHRCVDWDIWGGSRRLRYWDALAEAVRAACYSGPRVADWWERIGRQMSLGQPGKWEDRRLVAELLACGDDRAVLDVLRKNADALVLRVRVASDARKDAYEAREAEQEAGKQSEQESESGEAREQEGMF